MASGLHLEACCCNTPLPPPPPPCSIPCHTLHPALGACMWPFLPLPPPVCGPARPPFAPWAPPHAPPQDCPPAPPSEGGPDGSTWGEKSEMQGSRGGLWGSRPAKSPTFHWPRWGKPSTGVLDHPPTLSHTFWAPLDTLYTVGWEGAWMAWGESRV